VAGNGRTTALYRMYREGEPAPAGVLVDAGSGEWLIPMQYGVNAGSREQAEAFGVGHNTLPLLGGDVGVAELLGLFEEERLVTVLGSSIGAGVRVAGLDGDDLDALLNPPPPVFRKLDETAADGVPHVNCPNCGHSFPK
jgi:hypothetical protein